MLISFKLYEGKETGYEEGLTIGESVVETLSKGIDPKGSNGYIDNFFTSLRLLESFRKVDINLTGTIWRDEVKDIPLTSALDMAKKERGYAGMYRDNE